MNSELIKLIASRMDDSVLEVASKSRLWEAIRPLLEDQSFWYRRTQTLVNFDLEWNEKENWHQVYNVLSSLEGGSNPFSEEGSDLTVLELNEYNLTAVKLLLRLKYDPSVNESQSLVGAVVFGSPEVVQLLLNDSRLDPLDGEWTGGAIYALRIAAMRGRIDNMRVLLTDPRIKKSDEAIQFAMVESSANNRLETVALLIQEPLVDEDAMNYALGTAAQYNSLDVMNLLLQDSRTNIDTDMNVLRIAIERGYTEAVKLLLQDKRLIIPTGPNGALATAIRYDSVDIVRLLLADSRVTEDEEDFSGIDYALTLASRDRSINVVKMLLEDKLGITEPALLIAAERGHTEVLSLLLSDPRVDESREMVLDMLEFPDIYSDGVINILVRDRRVDLNEIDSHITKQIVNRMSKYTSDSVKRSVLLSGYSRGHILSIISETCNSFTECHYSMLLRDIILKRLDLEYYLRWILNQLKKRDTVAETRRLFSSAARSLSNESPIHTSYFFTAYRGFFLLAVSEDVEVILNTLRSEEGVTKGGLELAGALLGAYLGGR